MTEENAYEQSKYGNRGTQQGRIDYGSQRKTLQVNELVTNNPHHAAEPDPRDILLRHFQKRTKAPLNHCQDERRANQSAKHQTCGRHRAQNDLAEDRPGAE